MRSVSQAKTIESLILALEEKGMNHKAYYHYTTWDSAKKIIEGRSFLLTRGNALTINDQQEALMRGSWQIWNKTYIGSFSYGASENMAMWGLYGQPWEDAVRLKIPRAEMLEWVKSVEYAESWLNQAPISTLHDPNASLLDIVYVNGSEKTNNKNLTYNGQTWSVAHTDALRDVDTHPKMTGYIKSYAWRYENEVRLKIRLPRSTGTDKIRIPIPEKTVNAITITTGPCFIDKNDPLYDTLYQEGRIKESEFKYLVKYRPLCDSCKYGHFERK